MTHPSLILLPLLLALSTVLAGCGTVPVPDDADVYYGFTLIDPASQKHSENSWIIVRDGRISKVGSGQPPRSIEPSRAHDLTGRFVLPGFIDAHAHITATGMQDIEVRDGVVTVKMESDDRVTQHNARIALARGVTTVRNPGGDPVANARYDRMVASGAWLGPEAKHAGKVMEPPLFTGSMFGYPRTEAEWDAEAARQAALGMTYFKLYVSLSEQELASGIRAAQRHGLKAIAHLNRVSWTRAAELGVDGLEHALPTSPDLLEPEARAKYIAELGPTSMYMYRWFELANYDAPEIRELVELLSRRKVVTNMTLVVNELIYNIDRLEQHVPADELRDALPEVQAIWSTQMRASATGWTSDDFLRARAVMPKVLAFARMLHDAGVPMMIGTDAGGGIFYARELALHCEAGIPVWDVLRMATSATADSMGMGDRIGRIEPGYEADLTILEADPIVDIAAASRVYGVLNNGKLLRPADLTSKSGGVVFDGEHAGW